ncbi:hypothetical protein AB1N83_013121, partial [Pleurotus pulmonarius]
LSSNRCFLLSGPFPTCTRQLDV